MRTPRKAPRGRCRDSDRFRGNLIENQQILTGLLKFFPVLSAWPKSCEIRFWEARFEILSRNAEEDPALSLPGREEIPSEPAPAIVAEFV